MQFLICIILTLPLFSQEQSTGTLRDFTQNRLFLMSTGYTQPEGTVSLNIFEFVGYQALYTPFSGVQFNAGIVIPRNLIYGAKFQFYESERYVRALSLTVDASYFLNSDKTFKEHTKIYPSINGTFGFTNFQLSVSFVSYTVDIFKYVPRSAGDWIPEYDGYQKDRSVFFIPALMQVGLLLHSRMHRIKFINEYNFEYEGKQQKHLLRAASFGIKKYWENSSMDFAFITYFRHRYLVRPEIFVFPWIGWSMVL
jgi:hypothetical protein